MSLSARIAILRSRRLDLAATAIAVGGVLVATAAVVARLDDPMPVVALAGVAIVALLAATRRADDGFTMIVAARAEVGISPASGSAGDAHDDAFDDAAWRLHDATLVWPGFVVVALRRDGAGRGTRLVPLFDRELEPSARRALRRFLTWSLRGGDGPERSTTPIGPR